MSVMKSYEKWENGNIKNHQGHAFPTSTLSAIEGLLPSSLNRTAETGCGKSTILFSNISEDHTVFALDDINDGDSSSVRFYRDCPLTKLQIITEVFGPTQLTLPGYTHPGLYDCVLIDGPHGYPFPDLEYFFFYPHVKPGGFLILDDVNIPTIGRMGDILCEDDMWTLLDICNFTTAVFERTDAITTNPIGDEWWNQNYNRHRVSQRRDIYVENDDVKDVISDLHLDKIIHQ
jgi:hypothetical protein